MNMNLESEWFNQSKLTALAQIAQSARWPWDLPPFKVRLRFYLAYVLFRTLPFPW